MGVEMRMVYDSGYRLLIGINGTLWMFYGREF